MREQGKKYSRHEKMMSQRPKLSKAYLPPGSLRPETVDEFPN